MTADSLAPRRPAPAAPRLPGWSYPAALRAIRATLVVPTLFALCYEVAGNLQLATYAAFGGFATLLMASFSGTRRDKVIAHAGLGLAGTVLIVIGTAVNSSTVLATVVTLPVVFAVLFAGVAGPAAASGGTAALLAYVLPAASPGTAGMVPDRLAGWWLATIAGTAAVLLLSPRPPGDRLRAAAATSAEALADQLAAALAGTATPDHRAASIEAKHALLDAFTATPYRPTGLAAGDQALASLVGLLEWCTAVLCDSLSEFHDLRPIPPVERALLEACEATLHDVSALLRGDADADPNVERLETRLQDSVAHLNDLAPDRVEAYAEAVHVSFHARTLAVAVRAAVVDALVASRRADPELIAAQRRRWFGAPEDGERRVGRWLGTGAIALRHASLRSAWFRTSVRGAVALAAAVAVADMTGVQHGFWVVLGTLSVLGTSATSTGATAWRALIGTVAGFAVGGALILGIGSSTGALWAALPVAVFVAAYAPGVAPFAVGQAGFTVVVSVLFNLLAPAGWSIGVIRIEDVAIGCAV
ncbi:MAG TPA: FUSC family protein, partial [Mycobacteriales bacterium]|nr:FUSC family protein [Mycobacteriales bacterium]